MAVRPYYSSLSPFREQFRTGRPLLTYHHVGRRPRGARHKGLYLSERLFARQMDELKVEGFSTADFGTLTSPKADSRQYVFLTFDDGFRDVFQNALPILRAHRFTAIQFLVADLLGKTNAWDKGDGHAPGQIMDEQEVREWLAAGHQIGSHTRTHPWLTQIPSSKAREEIEGSKMKLEDQFGLAVDHFCYPYGDWNEAVRDLVIVAGYKTACTTKAGVNVPGESPFALKRFTARYPSRNLKTLWARVKGWKGGIVRK